MYCTLLYYSTACQTECQWNSVTRSQRQPKNASASVPPCVDVTLINYCRKQAKGSTFFYGRNTVRAKKKCNDCTVRENYHYIYINIYIIIIIYCGICYY